MSKHKVIVNVYGGVVQNVFADPDVDVVVVDWDVEGVDTSTLQRAVDSAGNRVQALCYEAVIENLDSVEDTDCGLMVAALQGGASATG